MEISLLVGRGGESAEDLTGFAATAAAHGLRGVWYGQHLRYDSPTLASMAASRAPGVLVGAGVVPAYPRHPVALAAQALTVDIASDHRFRLGVGPSHRRTIENIYGLDYTSPGRFLEEYLTILRDLLTTQRSDFAGRFFAVDAQLDIPEAGPVPLYTGSLGPRTLELCGRLADGNITYLAGPRTIIEHVIPSMERGAEAAGRARPTVVAAVPVMVTEDLAAARPHLDSYLGFHSAIDVYQAVVARERVSHPSEIAIVGDQAAVRAGIERFRESGVDEFAAAPFGTPDDKLRTCELLGELASESR
jgi:5,10-methylenetetrahydromethanopterin reductase